MAVKHIHVEIGELVLIGVAPAARHGIADALRSGLERALAEPGMDVSAATLSLERLVLPAVRHHHRSEEFGAALARAVATGLRAITGGGDAVVASDRPAAAVRDGR